MPFQKPAEQGRFHTCVPDECPVLGGGEASEGRGHVRLFWSVRRGPPSLAWRILQLPLPPVQVIRDNFHMQSVVGIASEQCKAKELSVRLLGLGPVGAGKT